MYGIMEIGVHVEDACVCSILVSPWIESVREALRKLGVEAHMITWRTDLEIALTHRPRVA